MTATYVSTGITTTSPGWRGDLAVPSHAVGASEPVETRTSVQSGDALRERGRELHGPAAPASDTRRLAGAGRTT